MFLFKYKYLEYGIGLIPIYNVKWVFFLPSAFFEYLHRLMDILKSNILLNLQWFLFTIEM